MKKWGWTALTALLLSNGALLLTMTPQTLAVEAPPSLRFPVATPPPEMTLAAIKAGRMTTMAAFAYRGGSLVEPRDFNMGGILVRHPQGDLLFDAGFGSALDEHLKTAPLLMRLTSIITAETTVAQQLEAAGIDRSRLRGVVLTHAHYDHVSGLSDLPGVPVWVTQAELDYIGSGAGLAQVMASLPDVKYDVYEFKSGAYLGFERSHDVYGDGSVVIVPAQGHTPGSIIAFVATPDGQRYALIGDIAWQREAIDIPAQRPWLPRLMVDDDAARNRELILKLHQLQQALPSLVVVPAHDRRVWNALPQLSG